MKEYCLDSINLDRCRKTDECILSSLVLCDDCFKLPIPQFQSYRQQNKTYCKSCYLNNNNKVEDFMIPNKVEMNLLERVIISCNNSTCEREFNINSLKEMIEHEKICGKVKVKYESNLQCKTCDHIYTQNYDHNCFYELKKNIEINNQDILHQMKTYFDQKYTIIIQENTDRLNLQHQEIVDKSRKIQVSEEKILNLERKLFTLGMSIIYSRRNINRNEKYGKIYK
jgi:hypothetical protein